MQIARSSSTTRIVGFTRSSCFAAERQVNREGCAAGGDRLGRDGPAVRFDRAPDDREPEAGAVRLLREERLEHARQSALGEARPVVRDHQARAAVAAREADLEATLARNLEQRV